VAQASAVSRKCLPGGLSNDSVRLPCLAQKRLVSTVCLPEEQLSAAGHYPTSAVKTVNGRLDEGLDGS